MKKYTFQVIFLSILIGLLSFSCKKDKKEVSKVEDNGLTSEINKLIPDSIITAMVDLGLPIYRGGTPPVLTGTFLASPFILKASNIATDNPGYAFADYYVSFYDQNNDSLSIRLDYSNGPESGNGLGGFIVGTNDQFTVFAQVNSTYGSFEAKLVQVVSGKLTASGIEDFYFANFMLDNFGNPGHVWIENGEGRIIYDSDSLATIYSSGGKSQFNYSSLSAGSALKLKQVHD